MARKLNPIAVADSSRNSTSELVILSLEPLGMLGVLGVLGIRHSQSIYILPNAHTHPSCYS